MAAHEADVDLVEDVFDEALDFLSEKTGYNVDALLSAMAVIISRRTGGKGVAVASEQATYKHKYESLEKTMDAVLLEKQMVSEKEESITRMTEKLISRADALVFDVELLGSTLLRSAKRLPSHPHHFFDLSSASSNSRAQIQSHPSIRRLNDPDVSQGKPEAKIDAIRAKKRQSTQSMQHSELAGIGIEVEDGEDGVRIARIDPLGSVGRSGAEVTIGSRLVAVGDKTTLSAVRGAAEVTEWLLGESGSRVTITVSPDASSLGHEGNSSRTHGAEDVGKTQTFEVMRGSASFLDQLLYVGAVNNLLSELSSSPGELLRPREDIPCSKQLLPSAEATEERGSSSSLRKRREGPEAGDVSKKRRTEDTEEALEAMMDSGDCAGPHQGPTRRNLKAGSRMLHAIVNRCVTAAVAKAVPAIQASLPTQPAATPPPPPCSTIAHRPSDPPAALLALPHPPAPPPAPPHESPAAPSAGVTIHLHLHGLSASPGQHPLASLAPAPSGNTSLTPALPPPPPPQHTPIAPAPALLAPSAPRAPPPPPPPAPPGKAPPTTPTSSGGGRPDIAAALQASPMFHKLRAKADAQTLSN